MSDTSGEKQSKNISATKIHFSGVQPSGDLHIGNYLGAVRQWVNHQHTIGPDDTFIFSIVDLHAITVSIDPEELRENVYDVAAWFIAAGLDPEKTNIFAQSDNPDHSYLAWIFNCITPMGWLERMIQYKEKSAKQGERSSAGLFTYPVLQAADILLYDAHEVPVGEDQVQHIELTRDIAKKFNNHFGETFVVPEVKIQKDGARVMSLQDPASKMSKSDDNQNGVIRLKDSPDEIVKKIKRAVTDSGSEITFSDDKPALKNLIAIYSQFSGESISNIEQKYQGKGYGDFKSDLAEVVVNALRPVQEQHAELMNNRDQISTVLEAGLAQARSISERKIDDVRQKVGLSR